MDTNAEAGNRLTMKKYFFMASASTRNNNGRARLSATAKTGHHDSTGFPPGIKKGVSKRSVTPCQPLSTPRPPLPTTTEN